MPVRIQALVCGPQPGTKGIFHGARLDRPTARGKGACSEALGKDLKEGDWVGGQVVGVHPKAGQKADQRVQDAAAEWMRWWVTRFFDVA